MKDYILFIIETKTNTLFDSEVLSIDFRIFKEVLDKKEDIKGSADPIGTLLKYLLTQLTLIDLNFIVKKPREIIEESETEYIKDEKGHYIKKIREGIIEKKNNAKKRAKKISNREFEEEWKDHWKEYTFRYEGIDYDKFWKDFNYDDYEEDDRLSRIKEMNKKEIRIKAKNKKEALKKAEEQYPSEKIFLHNTTALDDLIKS